MSSLPNRDWLADPAAVAARLRKALAAPLPGATAHLIMAPKPRAGWKPAHIPAGVRDAAALVLLYRHAREWRLALTVRAATLPHHGGQVSLPGGAIEPGETVEDAALREAREELGVDTTEATVLGRLSPLHIPVSQFVLHPVVGWWSRRPDFAPDAREVARLLEVPLLALADPSTLRLRWRSHEGRRYEVPYFSIEGEQVWGATAMVLGELLVALDLTPPLPGGGA
jgi:8-oxo-dGTP pyrophosphatase MutT (NUDIX family)